LALKKGRWFLHYRTKGDGKLGGEDSIAALDPNFAWSGAGATNGGTKGDRGGGETSRPPMVKDI